ncbi:MAG TPA: hypothetical protein VHL12_01390 [Gemmatimonadaceae bacterium]|jgi:hypothetical protein|nr:hypothetical protein [Gemmatimonadaceae bacterium]
MSDTVRVYVNARPVDVPSGSTALDAVEAFDATCAAEVRSGERHITDSRGIVTANDGTVHNGAIYRIVRARHDAQEDNDLAQP